MPTSLPCSQRRGRVLSAVRPLVVMFFIVRTHVLSCAVPVGPCGLSRGWRRARGRRCRDARASSGFLSNVARAVARRCHLLNSAHARVARAEHLSRRGPALPDGGAPGPLACGCCVGVRAVRPGRRAPASRPVTVSPTAASDRALSRPEVPRPHPGRAWPGQREGCPPAPPMPA